MVHCWFHKDDLDGICSGAIVKTYYKTCEMHPITYGEQFPWGTIHKEDLVYMVDFSLPFPQMIYLFNSCNLNWIDHHWSAIEEYMNYPNAPFIEGRRDITHAACVLTWEYFYGSKGRAVVPKIVELIGRYDMGDWSDEVLDFSYGMKLFSPKELEPGQLFWANNFAIDLTSAIALEGSTVRRYQKLQDERYSKSYAFECILFDKYSAICCNAGMTSSRLFDSVVDKEKHDLFCWFVKRAEGYTVSLCAVRDDIDCGAICKMFGGGGHKKIGGFQIPDINKLFDGSALVKI